MTKILIALFSSAFFFLTDSAVAQRMWYLEGPDGGKSFGVDIHAAYAKLEGREPSNVVVAVIDNGCDIDHPSLQPYIWENPGERKGNNIDDDNNGYIDDINGWNFLGSEDSDIVFEAFEEVRRYRKMQKLYSDTGKLTGEQKIELQHAKESYDNWQSYVKSMARLTDKLYANKDNFFVRRIFSLVGENMTNEEIEKMKNDAKALLHANTIDPDSARKVIVGDDPDNSGERYYGNNRIAAGDPSHGTHTAGIVRFVASASPDSGSWLRIMSIRAVPVNGDERDKDVANAIRYAVDNGAKVISMSFGKDYSPDVEAVRMAVRYAVEHDVLLVHGAGNDNKMLDSVYSYNYPNPLLDSVTRAKNWIEVGANTNSRKKLIAGFSNYGMNAVDILAPGSSIYSTIPGGKFSEYSGTSMAAPVVAGIAALIRSYFPNLSADEVKQLLVNNVLSTNRYYPVPGEKGVEAQLWYFCRAGGIVNAAMAVEAARKMQLSMKQ